MRGVRRRVGDGETPAPESPLCLRLLRAPTRHEVSHDLSPTVQTFSDASGKPSPQELFPSCRTWSIPRPSRALSHTDLPSNLQEQRSLLTLTTPRGASKSERPRESRKPTLFET